MLVRDIHQDASGSNSPPVQGADAVLARRVREYRELSEQTQRQIAELMTAAGHRMHQTTVAKIESGDRPVTIGEAVALADVLGVILTELVAPRSNTEQEQAHRELVDAQVAVRSLEHEFAERQKLLQEAQVLHDNTGSRLQAAYRRLAELDNPQRG
jgi:transcriptional regulator with XRE-family HTH domain